MKITVHPSGPLDAGATLARFSVWGEDPANRLGDGVFRRVLRFEGRLWPWSARWRGHVDDVRIDVDVPGPADARVRAAVRSDVEHVFGLAFDLPSFYRFAKSDRVLGALAEPLHGLRPTLTAQGLEMLVGSICAQQVNLAFAFTCRARLVRRYGDAVPIDGDTVWAFPEARVLAAASLDDLRAMQFSTRKAEYIRDVAAAVADGTLDLPALAAAPDAQVIGTLTGRRGLGRWTAEWYLARCLGRGAVCPAGDLGVRRAFERYYGRRRPLGEDAVRRRARAWGAHANVAIHYLLAGLRLALPAA